MKRLFLLVVILLISSSARASSVFDDFLPFFGGTMKAEAQTSGGTETVEDHSFKGVYASSDFNPTGNTSGSSNITVTPNHLFRGNAAVTLGDAGIGTTHRTYEHAQFTAEYVDEFRMIADPGSELPKFVQFNFLLHGFVNAQLAVSATGTGYNVYPKPGGGGYYAVPKDGSAGAGIGLYAKSEGSDYYDIELASDGVSVSEPGSQAKIITQAVSLTLPVIEVFQTIDGYTGGIAAIAIWLSGGASVADGVGSASVDFNKTLQLSSVTLPEYDNQTPQAAGFQVALASGLSVPVPEPAGIVMALLGFAMCAVAARRRR